MSQSSPTVCRYNQTGFCKYKDHCKKTHENQKCKNLASCTNKECLKRHPKRCKHFYKDEGCRFKEDCAYSHEDAKQTTQNYINNAVAVVVTKHNTEIKAIQEEVKDLKDLVESMKERLVALEKEIHKVREKTRAEVQIEVLKNTETNIELVISDND